MHCNGLSLLVRNNTTVWNQGIITFNGICHIESDERCIILNFTFGFASKFLDVENVL